MNKILLTLLIVLAFSPPAQAADNVGSTWGFFGDSQTAGRAPAGSLLTSSPEAIDTLSSLTSTEYISGLSGCSLADSITRYSAYGSKSALTWVHFQESGNQNLTGQTTSSEFASTFISSMTALHNGSPSAVITYETAYSFKREVEAYRDWSAYNATLSASVATLASSGITVKVADVNASVTWASAQLGDSVVWYQDGDVNEFHYTEVGNLMVAMTVWDALGYDVDDLDYSAITDVSSENINILKSYFTSQSLSVSGVNGTITIGQTVTITGTAFGTKVPAAPVLWAPFDGGINPSSLGRITSWDYNSYFIFEATGGLGGSGGVRTQTAPEDNHAELSINTGRASFRMNALGQKMYATRSHKINTLTGTNLKTWEFNRYPAGTYYGQCDLIQNRHVGAWITQGISNPTGGSFYTPQAPIGQWSVDELYWEVSSTANTLPTVLEYWIDGVLRGRSGASGDELYLNDGGSDQIMTQFAAIYHADYNAGSGNIVGDEQFDDVYLDDTWARVMLCPGSSWASRGQCAIQIPTFWSDTFITASINTGAFMADSTVYLYVVDADGAVNATGYEVTIGESSAPTPIDGVCGSNSGATLSSLTSGDVNNCSAGTVSGFTGSGPWLWTCAGINGGDPASCSASLASGSISAWLTSGGSILTSGGAVLTPVQ